MYPFKFKPIYKDYIWGGCNLKKFGKSFPDGNIAESWEISCHPKGVSVVCNGEYANISLMDLIANYHQEVLGRAFSKEYLKRFPLLVKLIDANDKLSVQVHPGNDYAQLYENGELGKSEMWYILEAKPGATLIYDLLPDINREIFEEAIHKGKVESCLKRLPVFPGDIIYIPSGTIHSIGAGITIVEIQQNSDITYRVYDYDRIDNNGTKRPLHIEKALDVIDFNTNGCLGKTEGLAVRLGMISEKKYLVANPYFAVELYTIKGMVKEATNGNKFNIFIGIEGTGEIIYQRGSVPISRGESVLIPATLGDFTIKGNLKVLKSYVPDLVKEIINPLKKAGYSEKEIYDNVNGLKYYSEQPHFDYAKIAR